MYGRASSTQSVSGELRRRGRFVFPRRQVPTKWPGLVLKAVLRSVSNVWCNWRSKEGCMCSMARI
eukprot:4203655-Pyramimonas_sp.AAC.1